MKTVIGLFDELHEAQSAVTKLLDRAVDRADISVVAHRHAAAGIETPATDVEQRNVKREAMAEGARVGAGTGAIVGTGIGGVLGFLAGIGTIFIPGIGPIVAAGPLLATLTGAGVGAAAGAALGSLVGALTQIGVPEHDAHFYAEAVRRGGTLVIVQAADDRASEIADVLTDAGAVDVEKRREQFSALGFTAFNPDAQPYTADQIAQERLLLQQSQAQSRGQTQVQKPAQALAPGAEPVKVSIAAEELKVGKRAVPRGRVEVFQHVTETPVEERVTLREEHISVDRRPVDRLIDPTDESPFQERSLELTEYAEEPVVAKETRVVEEVVIGRDVTERTEVVRDTVRRSDVEVVEAPLTNRPPPPPPVTSSKRSAS